MKVLLHTCCAVCLHGPLSDLRSAGHEVTAFFLNPNVHPLLEFRRRLKAFRVFAEADPVPTIADETYGLRDFLEQVRWQGARGERCADCYRLRLARTGDEAARGGFEAFTTTLLVSPMQDRDKILEAGRRAASRTGVEFLDVDWRRLFDESHGWARARSLYHQQYCGCIFSEQERFAPTSKHLYRGRADHKAREGVK